jgi:hypothetical protein
MCGLDAEGAFDGIPHAVLFDKAIDIISDMSWRLLYQWYVLITVQIRWNKIGNCIKVCKGTRQGGLTSPFLFNLVYKGLVEDLSNSFGGISIGSYKYNVFCYADDILLASTTVSGLQHLINLADKYVSNLGLKFNPIKTKCSRFGGNPFTVAPTWNMKGADLEVVDNLDYLGARVGNRYEKAHTDNRIRSCRKSFYALQGAGLCKDGLQTDVAIRVFDASCNSVLVYGCETMYLSKKYRWALDKIQAKLIKCIVGLNPFYRTTPLLNALRVHTATDMINMNSVRLLSNIMAHDSAARLFNLTMLQMKCTCKSILVNRVKHICDIYNLNFYKIIADQTYIKQVKKNILQTVTDGNNGTVDSIRQLLRPSYKSNMNMSLLRLLLKAF